MDIGFKYQSTSGTNVVGRGWVDKSGFNLFLIFSIYQIYRKARKIRIVIYTQIRLVFLLDIFELSAENNNGRGF